MSPADLITSFWFIIVLYWAISAIGVKRDVTKNSSWWRMFILRVIIIAAIITAFNFAVPSNFWKSAVHFSTFMNGAVQVVGIILCAAGIMFAMWARVHLGRNWSGSPQMKENHELVTSGPYRFVRHPIYTGIMLGLFGSGLAAGLGWFIAFIIFSVIFILRIKTEEGYMMKLFPNQYPAYRARTKAFIPFFW